MAFAVRAPILQARTAVELEHLVDAVVEIDDTGMIVAVHRADEPVATALIATGRVVALPAGQVLLPGIVDLHIHAPQWPQLGTGLDVPLERWLFEYTFPLEARYADPSFAAAVWDEMVPALLAQGTTTAVYYGTVHERATLELAAACARHGQRSFVGRVAMDHPQGTPEYYRDATAAAGLAASESSLHAIRSLSPSGLVQPIITPRFAPACTDELLQGLGELAARTGALVQTHCSESDWHHGYAMERFGTTDLEALARFGLAREHSVLAHATLLGDDELPRAAALGVAVAHCPWSNAFFGNAVFPVRRALAAGVRVGIGSDISGGSQPSVLRNASLAIATARLLEDGVDQRLAPAHRGVPESRLDAVTAFWLATAGGADALGLPVGLIEPGRRFDAIAVDVTVPGSPLKVWPELDDAARMLEKIVHLAGEREIAAVWVDGRQVR